VAFDKHGKEWNKQVMWKTKQWLQTAGNEENAVTVFVFRHFRIY
jgi:hypothetical protein